MLDLELLALFVLAALICNAAAGLAGGLAGSLAFAASAVLCAAAEVSGAESLNVLSFHFLSSELAIQSIKRSVTMNYIIHRRSLQFYFSFNCVPFCYLEHGIILSVKCADRPRVFIYFYSKCGIKKGGSTMKRGLFMEYLVTLTWDPEAAVWIATSADIPGLVLEDSSFDALIEKVQAAVPELIELNSLPQGKTIRYSPKQFQRACP